MLFGQACRKINNRKTPHENRHDERSCDRHRDKQHQEQRRARLVIHHWRVAELHLLRQHALQQDRPHLLVKSIADAIDSGEVNWLGRIGLDLLT